jgi:CheY-like chemotaxis protein
MTILIVSGIEGVRNCAEVVSKQLGMKVEFANGRREAIDALRHREFAVVVLDETLAECDPAAAEAIWERSGLAIPLQINFALAGAARVIREIRAALQRRQKEQAAARSAAREDIGAELKNTVSGLLLQSQLALAENGLPNHVVQKLRMVQDLAGKLRLQLTAAPSSRFGE